MRTHARGPGWLLLLGLSCSVACGRSAAPEDAGTALTGRLELATPGAFEVVEGGAVAGRSAWLTAWYARDSAVGAPELLGDERAALLADTPSRVRCPLPAAAAPRTLRTAVRRSQPSQDAELRCELFWQAGAAELVSLAAVQLPAADDAWHDLAADLPAAAGDLWLVARHAHPGLAAQAGGDVAWGAPVVAPAQAPDLPDVILIAIDTLRADAMDALPALAPRLAAGEWAPSALAASNWTLPAFASLWTGLPAEAHGAGRSAFSPQPQSGPEARAFTTLGPARSFAEALHDAGWATACVYQNPFLESWTGLARGFDLWVRAADAPAANRAPAAAWWRAQAHRPRLLVLHWMTPHLPYGAEDAGDPLRALDWRKFLAEDHEPSARRAFFDLPEAARAEVRRRYRAEVAALNQELAAALPLFLESARHPVLLFFADHGEELWDAGSFEHGHSFDDSVVRVPAAFLWPGHDAPQLIAGPAPAHHLGLHLLHRLAAADPRIAAALRQTARGLPPCGFAPGCPAHGAAWSSSRPLYRADLDGVRESSDGGRSELPFTGAGSGGEAPTVDPRVLRRLQELGYAGGG